MKRALFLLGFLSISFAAVAHAQTDTRATEQFGIAKVTAIESEVEENTMNIHRVVQKVRLAIISGVDTGYEWTTENGVLDDRPDMRLDVGSKVVIEKMEKADGSVSYLVRETYRLPSLAILLGLFLVLVFLFGGITGITSLVGLFVSVAILVFFVVPRIVAGSDPLLISLLAAVLIACTSLYLAHGFNKRTSVALFSTLVTLFISVLLAIGFVSLARIFGMGTEEAMYLQMGLLQNVDLRGLLLGGIIIGSLGVLDDVTTAQTAAIAEVARANPKLTFAQLYRSGASVGKEHIASLINTLALAYVGASFPLLLLLKTNSSWPLWMTINSEFIAEEIVRTLVGSATLLFAVPISTWFAAWYFQGGRDEGHGPAHHHHHV